MLCIDIFRELGLDQDVTFSAHGESHFLCVFDEQGHHNLGDSNEWADPEKFEAAALKILAERLGEYPVDQQH
jgi:hypothetical protein